MEWLLWSVPQAANIRFQANIGSKLLFLDVEFKKGDNAEAIMLKIFEKEGFPEELRTSMLSSLHSMLLFELQEAAEESLAVQDKSQVIHKIPQLKEELTGPVTFSTAYQFLISLTNPTVQDTLRQLEISYIKAILELQERAEHALSILRSRQSDEMDKASTRVTDPTKISMIVAKHVEDVEKMERKWNEESEELRRRQRHEYHEFVINFHHIESQRLLTEGERETLMSLINHPNGFLSSQPSTQTLAAENSPTTASKNNRVGTMDAKISKMLSSSTLSQISKPRSLIGGLLRKKQQPQMPTVRSADVAIPTALVSALPEGVMREISETFMITCSPLLYSLRVTCQPLLEVARASVSIASEDSIIPPLLAPLGSSVYGQSLSAIILLVDRELQYKTKNGREFIRLVNATTDFHFSSFDEQLSTALKALPNGKKNLVEGDYFVTRHSNLGGINVVFHLITETKKNFVDLPPLVPEEGLLRSLSSIFSLSMRYDIEVLLMPFLLLEPQTLHEEQMITPESIIFERAQVVLKLFATMLEENLTEDFKSLVLTLPSSKHSEGLQKAAKQAIQRTLINEPVACRLGVRKQRLVKTEARVRLIFTFSSNMRAAVFVCLLLVSLSAASFKRTYSKSQNLNGNNIVLNWNTNATHIQFGLATTYTGGWTAFGLNSDGQMSPGTDVYAVSASTLGDYTITASHSNPAWDSVQNIFEVSINVSGNTLYAEFSRPLTASSPDVSITNSAQTVIWSFNPSTATAANSNLSGGHQNGGHSNSASPTQINFLAAPATTATQTTASGPVTTSGSSRLALSVFVIFVITALFFKAKIVTSSREGWIEAADLYFTFTPEYYHTCDFRPSTLCPDVTFQKRQSLNLLIFTFSSNMRAAVFVCLLLVSLSAADFQRTYSNSQNLNGNNIVLNWNTNATHIQFGLATTYTGGWTAFGLNSDGQMSPGTDVYAVSADTIGDYTIDAEHSNPSWDSAQNIFEISLNVTGDTLYAEFSRPLTASSPDLTIADTQQTIIWAFNPNTPLSANNNIPVGHQNGGHSNSASPTQINFLAVPTTSSTFTTSTSSTSTPSTSIPSTQSPITITNNFTTSGSPRSMVVSLSLFSFIFSLLW
ncbi:hypothetical protein PROFUN_04176 [Planoprotostelium fungivorum]|uniref:DOMON domain-containing protein n=1 Tax=Planoprotostelium fungivorum TaxID=1890364 RepID=A0A2P6NVU6_9EUKA|nr:hypothetical protein PROFUN_04176 [Planoprotostelium fungivorum]